ncbi:hypothetical protein AJ85_01010 [Alkalihalobacillus alcalophilus ATCC 27647 = CGMCC 1.3604]|uniref:Uncharacterized protein n=1 Tax=Alkalihalobacillus alcalophilus ATCC 27647 = CGMCC 1.3604 TaxID=1218173 RepID=A0A4S4K705_ALKAL|nr:hypothetical protein AJ85_01010 [Alkalihalobacillus alcalophilus ATCC 27647 = CGMCC 1.3604]
MKTLTNSTLLTLSVLFYLFHLNIKKGVSKTLMCGIKNGTGSVDMPNIG